MPYRRYLTGKLATILTALTLCAGGSAVSAADWVFGVGYNSFDRVASGDRPVFSIDVLAQPFKSYSWVDLSFGASLVAHSNGDLWAGTGIAALAPLKNRWFVEASLMPGAYHASSEASDLGHDIEFRSLIGIGRQIGEKTSLSLAVFHLSNASISDVNPGVNSIALRLRRSF